MSLQIVSLGSGLLLLPFLFVTTTVPSDAAPKPPRYVGVKSCKNCHKGEKKGDAHAKWAKGPHAKAYETLGSAKAKEIAAKLKIDDPQKSAKCLKCHVTAYEVDKKLKKRGLKIQDGIGCESCHGPGEEHSKVRLKEAAKGGVPAPVAADEIKTNLDVKTCVKCHNDESPTFKPFCFKERMAKIRHLDPRKKRTPKDIKALEAKCSEGCKVCAEKKDEKKEKGATDAKTKKDG